MEKSNKYIETAILNFLSKNINQVKNINDIYIELKNNESIGIFEKDERTLFKIISMCSNLNKKNDKIYKLNSNQEYLYTDNFEECIDFKEKKKYNNNLEIINISNISKDIVTNPIEFSFIHINDMLDGKLNTFHYCSGFENPIYLERLFDYYDVDINIKSSDGLTGLEIALDKGLAHNVNLINKYKYQKIGTNLKLINKKLNSECNSLNLLINNLKKSNVEKDDYLLIFWALIVALFIIFHETQLLISVYLNPLYIFISVSLLCLQLFLDKLFIFKIKLYHLALISLAVLPFYFYI
jgi:hypothetical protein